jgi:hypothetical protein
MEHRRKADFLSRSTQTCTAIGMALMLSACTTANTSVVPQGEAPPPSIVMQKLPAIPEHYKSAKALINESRANPSALEHIPPMREPTALEKDIQQGLLALSIVRVVSTPFMLP